MVPPYGARQFPDELDERQPQRQALTPAVLPSFLLCCPRRFFFGTSSPRPFPRCRSYLQGSKKYFARGELGFETTTLDTEGNVTKTADVDHVTMDMVRETIPKFIGTLQQVPPIFSAVKQGGKRLYEQAREGKTEDLSLIHI